jgi:hypothetical protein
LILFKTEAVFRIGVFELIAQDPFTKFVMQLFYFIALK